MQEFELGRHKLVHVWGQEARKAGKVGEEHQRQALALLRRAAVDRAAERTSEEELRELWEGIGERHREATALRSACRHTQGLREAAEHDVAGLREVSSELAEQHQRTLKLVGLAKSVAAASPRLQAQLGLQAGAPTAFDGEALPPRSANAIPYPVTYAGDKRSGAELPMGVEVSRVAGSQSRTKAPERRDTEVVDRQMPMATASQALRKKDRIVGPL
eukprot:TRINITY_DN16188_c0_g1_i1.p1 TRINITY_DN16188_c0_g1~~TRINITY_DN16188_c0_g1_i1.p1  ORF type:complete len:217 (-),score=43.48 TRINITY_DN16188_c0_g1_i1:9-659(-)